MLYPIKQLNLQPSFYQINDDFTPVWSNLDELVNNKTKAIVMVHYFGQPQDIFAFQGFCKRFNLFLIEDNAHGYWGKFNGKLLGTFGDLGISSPRKLINTYSGGILWLRDQNLENIPQLLPYPVSLGYELRKKFFVHFPTIKNQMKKLIKKRPQFEDPRAFKESEISDYSIDKFSQKVLEMIDWNLLMKKRQICYAAWNQFALENELTPAYDRLYDGANPWCFPSYAKNQRKAIRWFNWGWENNINVFSWPQLPETVIKNNSSALDRWRRLVCFDTNSFPDNIHCI